VDLASRAHPLCTRPLPTPSSQVGRAVRPATGTQESNLGQTLLPASLRFVDLALPRLPRGADWPHLARPTYERPPNQGCQELNLKVPGTAYPLRARAASTCRRPRHPPPGAQVAPFKGLSVHIRACVFAVPERIIARGR
jgi:hypothetical protein